MTFAFADLALECRSVCGGPSISSSRRFYEGHANPDRVGDGEHKRGPYPPAFWRVEGHQRHNCDEAAGRKISFNTLLQSLPRLPRSRPLFHIKFTLPPSGSARRKPHDCTARMPTAFMPKLGKWFASLSREASASSADGRHICSKAGKRSHVNRLELAIRPTPRGSAAVQRQQESVDKFKFDLFEKLYAIYGAARELIERLPAMSFRVALNPLLA